MNSTERVRLWRAEQRRKAKLYDQLEAARVDHLKRQALEDWPPGLLGERRGWRKELLEAAVNDPVCLNIFAKA